MKEDSKLGLEATVSGNRDDAVSACTRAVGVLGKRAKAQASSAAVTVYCGTGLTAEIRLRPVDDGRITVTTSMVKWRTSGFRVLFVPVTPRRIEGKSRYLALLRALEQELHPMTDGSGPVKHLGAWS